MPNRSSALQKKNIHLKGHTGPKTSGHEVDFGTYTTENDAYRPWITKLNKHVGDMGVSASVLEVAFSQVASLFMKPGLTPPAKLVLDENNNVIGVASENFNVQIKKLMDAGKTCYSLDPTNWTYTPISMAEPDADSLRSEQALAPDLSDKALKERLQLKEAQKGVHFLDKMSENFFHTLMEKHKRGELIIDMGSLSSVLTCSYFLEEDDLHKGNIGFYLTDIEDPKNPGNFTKLVTFFKIDHDLMVTDSIMSKRDMRVANVFYDKNSFKMTRRDIKNFPDLQDSGNHYWPTKRRFMVAGTKAYNNKMERQAYAGLKNYPEFNNAKGEDFLKYTLIPIELVESSLKIPLSPPEDLDVIHMIRNSVNARMVKHKQILLKSPELLAYLQSDNGKAAKEQIKNDISEYMENAGMEQEEQKQMLAKIDSTFNMFVDFSQTNYFSLLEKTLVLDCYRFTYFGNPTGDEIRFAATIFDGYRNQGDNERALKYACIVANLIAKSDVAKDVKAKYLEPVNDFKKDYLKPESITTLDQFKSAADTIRRTNLPLKQQKMELAAVLKDSKLSVGALQELKNELKQQEPNDPSLKFIKQLRSDLWLIRKIFGIYGKTATSSMMIKEIDSQIKTYCESNTKLSRDGFYAQKNKQSDPNDEDLSSKMKL